MKLNIGNASFEKLVKTVSKAIDPKTSMPILGGILISAEDGRVTLEATDLNTYVRCEAAAFVEEAGETVVSGKVLSNIVKALPDEAVSIYDSGSRTVIACGKARYTLNTLPSRDFPEFPVPGATSSVELPVAAFAELTNRVKKVASKDQARPILGCVHLKVDDELVVMAATDSYRLAVCSVNLPTSTEGRFESTIPAKALADALGMASGAETVEVGSDGGIISLRFGATTYMIRKVEGTYPDWRMLVPKTCEVEARTSVEGLAAALNRVSAVSTDSMTVTIDAGAEGLLLTVEQDGEGVATDRVEAEVVDELTMAVNRRFLAEGLSCMDPTEELVIRMTSAMQPMVLRNFGNIGYTYLLMPVRMQTMRNDA